MAKENVKPNTVRTRYKDAPKADVRQAAKHPDATVNLEGALAYKVDARTELYLRAAACLLKEPMFYDPTGEKDEALADLVEQVSKVDPEFVLRLASFCRNEMYLRSVPMFLLVEAAAHPETRAFVRRYVPDIVKRADELAEVIAMYKARNGDIGDQSKKGMLSNPLKRGLADVFSSFNEYNLAKYDRDGEVKLKDVLRIVHPKPKTPEQSALYARVRDRTLKVPATWETVISSKGSNKEAWESILPQMPFMARLRNLRNLLDKGADVTPVLEMLKDPEAVKNSKQFPYRFYSAYREIEGHQSQYASNVLEALETSMDLSVENIQDMPGVSAVFADNSPSMSSGKMSEKSKVCMVDVAGVMSAIAHRMTSQTIVGAFADEFKVVNLGQHGGILSNAVKIRQTDVGSSTFAWKAVAYLRQHKVLVDRIMLFSDMQCYNDSTVRSAWGRDSSSGESLEAQMRAYRREMNPDVYLYSIDLAGYGTSQFPKDSPKTALLAGFSDRVLKFIPAFEHQRAMMEEISGVTAGRYARKEKVVHESEEIEAAA